MAEEYGLETAVHPRLPSVDLQELQGNPELVANTLVQIFEYCKKLPIYADQLKEGINSNFLPRLKGVEDGLLGLDINVLFADLIRISHLLYLGDGENFHIDGINRTITIYDNQDPPVKRLEIGLFAGGVDAGLKAWDADGNVLFSLSGIPSEAIQEATNQYFQDNPVDDGSGFEEIYAAHSSDSLDDNQEPDNDWGYGEEEEQNGVTWTSTAPSVTADDPYLFRARRAITGIPSSGDDVDDDWAVSIVGHFGQDGAQGEDGGPGPPGPPGQPGIPGVAGSNGVDGAQGPQGIYTIEIFRNASSTPSTPSGGTYVLSTNTITPPSDWTTTPSNAGSGEQTYISRFSVNPASQTSDSITPTWSMPFQAGATGPQGPPGAMGTQGLQGVPGARGDDGDPGADGVGYEYIFAVYSESTLPTAKRPDNTWGYDSPGTADGLQWYDAAQDVTSDNDHLFTSQRIITGTPAVGDTVSDNWTVPRRISRFAPQGEKGDTGDQGLPGVAGAAGQDGNPGEDGVGYEYIFAVYTSDTLPVSKRPSNSWGYDEPSTIDSLQWHDAAPTLTAVDKTLFRAERVVTGTPAVGDAVTASWSTPAIVGRYGDKGDQGDTGLQGLPGANGQDGAIGPQGNPGNDGDPGADGDPGVGYEYIFAVYTNDTLPASKRPLNTWGYDSPETVDSLQWHDGAPTLTSDNKVLFRAERVVSGTPAVGDSITDTWSVPVIVGRYGDKGDKGDPGDMGVTGSTGADGPQGIFNLEIYRNAASTPSTPSGGSYVLATNALTAPADWTTSPSTPSTGENTYISRASINPATQSGTITPTWGMPFQAGATGPMGMTGSTGAAGAGYEYIFTVYTSDTLPTSKYPDNSWGYDQPGTIDSQVWTDGAPTLTSDNKVLFRAERSVSGIPAIGADISDDWSTPVIVGRYGDKGDQGQQGEQGLQGIAGANGQDGAAGMDGAAGEDGDPGVGYEYIFAVYTDDVLPSSKHPDNTWGYDEPSTIDELQWHDGAPTLSATNKVLFRAERIVSGTPTVGDAISDTWSTPVIVGRYGDKGDQGDQGEQGQQGDPGIAGAAGMDGNPGADGVGYEYIFAVYTSDTLPTSKYPLDSWGYDEPATVDGLTWSDGAPTLTSTDKVLFRSDRIVTGTPATGDTISTLWGVPVIVGRYGDKGDQGDQGETGLQGQPGVNGQDGAAGQDGDDGVGYEYVFAATSTATLEVAKYPSNDWGYDEPSTSDGLTWNDAAPNVSESNPYLYVSQRTVIGTPATGDAITAVWTVPKVIARYGIDGTDGINGTNGMDGNPGADGTGYEYIFAATSPEFADADNEWSADAYAPSNTWGYDSPGTVTPVEADRIDSVESLVWTDAAVGIDQTVNTLLWRSQRDITGTPSTGDAITDTWSTPIIVARTDMEGYLNVNPVDGTQIEDGAINLDGPKVTGVLRVGHIDADVQNVIPVWGGNSVTFDSSVNNNIYLFELSPSLKNLLPHITSEPLFTADYIWGFGEPTGRGKFNTWGIPYNDLFIGTNQAVPTGAKSIFIDEDEEIQIWRNSAGTKIFMKPKELLTGGTIHSIIAVKNPDGTGGTSTSITTDATPITSTEEDVAYFREPAAGEELDSFTLSYNNDVRGNYADEDNFYITIEAIFFNTTVVAGYKQATSGTVVESFNSNFLRSGIPKITRRLSDVPSAEYDLTLTYRPSSPFAPSFTPAIYDYVWVATTRSNGLLSPSTNTVASSALVYRYQILSNTLSGSVRTLVLRGERIRHSGTGEAERLQITWRESDDTVSRHVINSGEPEDSASDVNTLGEWHAAYSRVYYPRSFSTIIKDLTGTYFYQPIQDYHRVNIDSNRREMIVHDISETSVARTTEREFQIPHFYEIFDINNDGTYIYILGRLFEEQTAAPKVFVYRISNGARQTGREFTLHSSNADPDRMTIYDNEYMVVWDATDEAMYVYRLSNGNRQTSMEITIPSSASIYDLDELRMIYFDNNKFCIVPLADKRADREVLRWQFVSDPPTVAPTGDTEEEENIPDGWTEDLDTTADGRVYLVKRTSNYENQRFLDATAWNDFTEISTGNYTIKQYLWRRAASTPSVPTGGTSEEDHIPTDWGTEALFANSTGNSYRIERTLTYSNRAFSSATAWGSLIQVDSSSGALSLTNPGNQAWTRDGDESLSVGITNAPTQYTVEWSESPAMPGTSGSGLIYSGMPTTNGTYTITLTVTDDNDSSNTDTISFDISVSSVMVTIDQVPDQTWTLNQSNSFTIAGYISNWPSPYIPTFSFSPTMPGVSGSGVTVSGTPTAAGTYTVTITITEASDASNTASVSFDIEVS